MDPEHRITILEQQNLSQQRMLEDQARLLTSMAEDLRTIRTELTKWKGMAAGVFLTVSAIWGVVLALWQFVKHKVS